MTEFTRRDVNSALLASALALAAGELFKPVTPRHLFDFAIAGRGYHDLDKRLADMSAGTVLILLRERANPHDPFAVAVHMADGAKLGFIPRIANEPVATLLDDGQTLTAIVTRFLVATRARDVPDDLVFTMVASGDPIVGLAHVPT